MKKISLTLPPDVISILEGVARAGNMPKPLVQEAICHLARSYDSIMEEQGLEGHPVEIPPPENEGMPSAEEINQVIQHNTQPAAALSGPILQGRGHNTSTPREEGGLVPIQYILGSMVPIIQDYTTNNAYDTNKKMEARLHAIQHILSGLPEDTWSGSNVPAMVDKMYRSLLK